MHFGGEITSALHDLLVVSGDAVEVLLDEDGATLFGGRELGGVGGRELGGVL